MSTEYETRVYLHLADDPIRAVTDLCDTLENLGVQVVMDVGGPPSQVRGAELARHWREDWMSRARVFGPLLWYEIALQHPDATRDDDWLAVDERLSRQMPSTIALASADPVSVGPQRFYALRLLMDKWRWDESVQARGSCFDQLALISRRFGSEYYYVDSLAVLDAFRPANWLLEEAIDVADGYIRDLYRWNYFGWARWANYVDCAIVVEDRAVRMETCAGGILVECDLVEEQRPAIRAALAEWNAGLRRGERLPRYCRR